MARIVRQSAFTMEAVKQKLAAFQQSRVGLFLKKFSDDQGTNLASLLAWGTLNTLLPLLFAVLALAGLVLRDPRRLDEFYTMLTALIPSAASGPLSDALQRIRDEAAAPASVVGVVLLLWTGSGFFSNMASIFDQVFHVEDRNFIMQRVVAVLMLIVVTALLVISVLALGTGSFFDALKLGWPIGPVLARAISWSISIVSAIATFLLLYRVLPNKKQTFGQALPGALLSTLLFFVILLVFPLYVTLFPPNHAYAVFGVFLVFTFFLYLLGIDFVLGAELNAFLQEPERSVALAEAQARAQRGKAQYQQQTGQVVAHATGDAPHMGGGSDAERDRPGPLGHRTSPSAAKASSSRPSVPENGGSRPGIGGRVVGALGLVAAALLIRGRASPRQERA